MDGPIVLWILQSTSIAPQHTCFGTMILCRVVVTFLFILAPVQCFTAVSSLSLSLSLSSSFSTAAAAASSGNNVVVVDVAAAAADILSPKALVSSWLIPANPSSNNTNDSKQQQQQQQISPRPYPFILSKSILMVPPKHMKETVVFVQRATNTRLHGRSTLESISDYWESTFETTTTTSTTTTTTTDGGGGGVGVGGGVAFDVDRISTIGPTTVIVQWNVTWVPPTSWVLEFLATQILRVTPAYETYTHRSHEERTTFSYTALLRLFQDASQTKRLRIPLACIQGMSTLEFENETKTTTTAATTTTTTTTSHNDDDDDDDDVDVDVDSSATHPPPPPLLVLPQLKSISEELNYAQDLQRGTLRNRNCANDLKLFLETGRCIRPDDQRSANNNYSPNQTNEVMDNKNSNNKGTEFYDWNRVVAEALPWETVPGMMNPLDIDGQEDGAVAVPLFLGIVLLSLVSFSVLVAPELLGQSIF
jgi:hypothetical protein